MGGVQGTRWQGDATPRIEPLADGTSLGDWRLVDLLSASGWSCVYRARPAKRRDGAADYALKIATGEESSAGEAERLLRREALVAREVAHPHLTCVLAHRLRQPPCYLVLPYLDGHNLENVLRVSRCLEVSLAVGVARRVAEALRALHRRRWLHGDVKPANIQLAANGHVTLLDLGLARRVGEVHPSGEESLGMTVDYAAPELFTETGTAEPASDVYSLGIVLHRLLAGRLPFVERSPERVAEAHLFRRPPDVQAFNPRVPAPLAGLLGRMLEKQTSRRPSDDELVARLIELEVTTAAVLRAA